MLKVALHELAQSGQPLLIPKLRNTLAVWKKTNYPTGCA
jgi:hypothetical protein